MGDARNANAFSLPCCYQFIFSIWVLKRRMEVSLCPSIPPCLPPGDKGGQKSRKFWFLSTAHQGHLNTNQTSSHNASLLANLGSLPRRSASILNGNYHTHTHTHTHSQGCIRTTWTVQMKCKRQRGEREEFRERQKRKWGVEKNKFSNLNQKKKRKRRGRSVGNM